MQTNYDIIINNMEENSQPTLDPTPKTPEAIGGESFNQELASPPIPPEIPKKKSTNLPIIIISIIIALILVAGAIAFFCFPNLFKSKDSTDSKSIVDLRMELFLAAAENVFGDGPARPLTEVLDEFIKTVPDSDSRTSLEVFSIYLLMYYEFYGSASGQYSKAVSSGLNEKDLCEAKTYNYILARHSGTTDVEERLRERNSACESVFDGESYAREENETDEKYGERLFLSGAYDKSISVLEGTNFSEYIDSERNFVFGILLGHYRIINDEANYNHLYDYYYNFTE